MDLANFHHTVPASTPLCSAQDITHLREIYKAGEEKAQALLRNDENSSSPPPTNRRRRASSKSADAELEHGTINPVHDVSMETDPGCLGSTNSLTRSPKAPRMVDARRAISLEERVPLSNVVSKETSDKRHARRCSLGDLIRASSSKETDFCQTKMKRDDALNIYRHRPSVTDTYLGTSIEEEMEDDEENSEAILSIVSRRSEEMRVDMRDVFKRRRSSVSKLFFGPATSASDEEAGEGEELQWDTPSG